MLRLETGLSRTMIFPCYKFVGLNLRIQCCYLSPYVPEIRQSIMVGLHAFATVQHSAGFMVTFIRIVLCKSKTTKNVKNTFFLSRKLIVLTSKTCRKKRAVWRSV